MSGDTSGSVEDRLAMLLMAIAAGRVKVWRVNSRASVYVRFETDNGWKLAVFNDVAEWDYLEAAESPYGDKIGFEEISRMTCIDWGLVRNLPVWGEFLRCTEFDPEYPDRELGS
ncbi:MAG TPA: hypothetical protein VFE62_27150 [Gemmataceae bacterium]|nr:hypothetical protein [Pirellulales bacterium]HZZ82205.1 hypothetical protein [Gemmataceae bacterium]